MYLFFPALRVLDILMGLVQVALAVWALFARQSLYGYKSGAPAMYTALQAATIAVSTLYLVSAFVIVGGTVVNTQSVGSIIGSGIMLACNVVYFRKRAFLFNR